MSCVNCCVRLLRKSLIVNIEYCVNCCVSLFFIDVGNIYNFLFFKKLHNPACSIACGVQKLGKIRIGRHHLPTFQLHTPIPDVNRQIMPHGSVQSSRLLSLLCARSSNTTLSLCVSVGAKIEAERIFFGRRPFISRSAFLSASAQL